LAFLFPNTWPNATGAARSRAEVATARLRPNIEGEWDAVKRCHERVHEMGAPRITTTIKLGTRTDRDQSMADKVQSVERQLG